MGMIVFGVFLLGISFLVFMAPQEFKQQLRPLVVGSRVVASLMIVAGLIFGGFKYAEPGYMYHVRDIFGQERVVDRNGWYFAGWREPIMWPKEITVSYDVQNAAEGAVNDDIAGAPSSALPPYEVTMADNVKGTVTAVVRFRLPEDDSQFLDIAARYRSPGRLVSTALKPSVEQAFDATASMVTAEGYFTSERNEFKQKFREIMQKGVPNTRRTQKRISVAGSDAGATGTDTPARSQLGDETKLVYVLEEIKGPDGNVIRNNHNFQSAGIAVADAILTQFDADDEFERRIKDRRDAAAQVAIAKERRRQEEEQRLLEIAKGQKEIAIEQAAVQRDQIKRETEAETARKLAVIEATKQKEQATISKETAQIELEKAQIDAQRIKELAEAEAYQKRVVLEADNALAQKLATYEQVSKVWADAYAQRKVPTTVFGGSGDGGVGSNMDVNSFMSVLGAKALRDLDLDLNIQRQQPQ